MQELFIKHSKKIIIFSLIIILICISSIIITIINNHLNRKTILSLQFAPSSAALKIDNTDYDLRNGSYEINPGHYTGTIYANGFSPKDISFDIKPHQINAITDYLVHTKEGLQYFEKSAPDINTLRHIKDDEAVIEFINNYDRKASIYDLLPQDITYTGNPETTDSNTIYILRVTDGTNNPNCQSTLCLSTTGIKQNNSILQDYLNQHGYNINDYEVFYDYSRV